MTSAQPNPRPLDGITVVSIEQAIAAPLCTRHLADLGARVIKIERHGDGDFARHYDERVTGLASHFVWVNRGKESVCMDVKNPDERALLHRILAKADVFVQNLAPGAAARLGLGYNDLSQQYPQLIVCDISGYGQTGPYAHKKAYDLLIQSESGFLSTTGSEQEMAKAGISIADICAGMYAYSAILSALLLRQHTQEGSYIDVSMLESMVEWMGYPLYYSYHNAPPPPRAGAAHATIYPYAPFPCADGEVMLGLQNEREWRAFCETVLEAPELISHPHFASNSLRSQHRHEINQHINRVFQALSRAEIIQRLEKAGIANAQVNQMADVWQHPQLKARHRWREIQSPAGALPALLPPAPNNRFEYRMGAIPALGEHTATIWAEFSQAEKRPS